jgi:hypothetical protein
MKQISNGKKWALIFMIVLALVVTVFDVVLYFNPEQLTISQATMDMLQDNPMTRFPVFFILGVLCGHLFWPQRPHLRDKMDR